MRIKKQLADISPEKVRAFYDSRAQSYNGANLNNVTMLQDKNPELSEKRSRAEISKLLPKLKVDSESCILDFGCGSGRWLDALPECIMKYRGIDFSAGLVELARTNYKRNNAEFFTGSVLEADRILAGELGTFNRVLMIGFLMYMNDSDIMTLLRGLPALISDSALICVKASIALEERLTLKDFYSEELRSEYESIYRTRNEYMKIFEAALIPEGFRVTDEGALYDDESLNNRKETTQYYFILERP